MKPIIRVENLSKRYQTGIGGGRKETFREALVNFFKSPFGGFVDRKRAEFWALQDVNAEIKPGEVVGIIGRNGAGKSTLLKILSQITEPTVGSIELFGRVGSLLEVGTGFHPELTGRENIFLNGAILGMKRGEIAGKFDEIVDFAEIEKFIDTPVKRYSSGMYMRLAFAVAANLEPEILIIDEVLAVGDVEFQRKCLGKMKYVSDQEGRTVLFVSHNMAAVENLCSRGIVLEKGKIVYEGTQTDSIRRYLESAGRNAGADLSKRTDRDGTGEIRITAIEIKDAGGGGVLYNVMSGQDIEIHFRFEAAANAQKFSDVNMGFMVRTLLDVPVFLQHNRLTGDVWRHLPAAGIFVCRIRRFPLPAASYRWGFSVMRDGGGGEYLDRIDDLDNLVVTEGDFYGSGNLPPATHGTCLVDAEWRLMESA